MTKIGEAEKVRLFARAGAPMRVFLMNAAVFMFVGIWLTGFDKVHWLIYVIPGVFAASSTFGVCPGLNLWRILLGRS